MIWYSLSVSVRAGATVMESPVCTPIGSTFSMAQTMIALSADITDHLHFEFLPAEEGIRRPAPARQGLASSPERHDGLKVVAVVGDAAAGAAEREGGADDGGQAHVFDGGGRHSATPAAMSYLPVGTFRGGDDGGLRVFKADAVHRLAEEFAIFCHFDGFALGPDQLDVILFRGFQGRRGRGRCSGLSGRPWSAAGRRGVPFR